MLNQLSLCAIFLFSFIKSTFISLPGIDSKTAEICWGDKKISLAVDSIPHILSCYAECLEAMRKYEGSEKSTLYDKLSNNIVCIRPMLNSEYYSGNIGYSSINEAHKLLEDVRNGHRANFNGKPFNSDCKTVREVRSTDKNNASPLTITSDNVDKEKACETLLKLQEGKDIESIPTPQLDDNNNPTELKVPTSGGDSYKIDSPEAGVALTKYYKIVMKCLTLKNKHKHLILRFNKDLYDWLSQAVMPHLKDDKLYPAFGGVLRILETMKTCDYITDNSTDRIIEFPKMFNDTDEGLKIISSRYFPIILIPWAVFLIMLVIFLLWKSLSRSRCWNKYKDDSASGSDTAILFYPVEESTTSVSMDCDDMNDSSYATSSIKSDKRSYNTLGQTANSGELMGVPKKKKNRHRKSNAYDKGTSSTSGSAEVRPSVARTPLYLDIYPLSSDNEHSMKKQKKYKN